MLRYYYINKEWIVSSTARRIYRASATLSLMLFLILWALRFPVVIPPSMLPILRLLALGGVVGAAITMVAMEYFLFGFDDSPAWAKMFWFCVMLLPLVGPPIYCFAVYSRSDVVRESVRVPKGTQS